MKRIYFTAVPLESNFLLEPQPLHPVNFSLNTAMTQSAYPILPVIDATLAPGDEGIVVAVRQQNSPRNQNMEILRRELEALPRRNWTLRELVVPERQQKDLLLDLFARLIDCMEDDACYYACMTFGTKTFPVVLFSALSYADKICRNTQIGGIYYREILRSQGQNRTANLYDVTALFTLNALVDLVAGMEGSDKDKMIRQMLEL